MVVEGNQQSIWRCKWRELRDAHKDHDHVKILLPLEALIKQVGKFTFSQRSSAISDTHRANYHMNFKIHFEAVILHTERYRWRP